MVEVCRRRKLIQLVNDCNYVHSFLMGLLSLLGLVVVFLIYGVFEWILIISIKVIKWFYFEVFGGREGDM